MRCRGNSKTYLLDFGQISSIILLKTGVVVPSRSCLALVLFCFIPIIDTCPQFAELKNHFSFIV